MRRHPEGPTDLLAVAGSLRSLATRLDAAGVPGGLVDRLASVAAELERLAAERGPRSPRVGKEKP
jgi:hypothetical protein